MNRFKGVIFDLDGVLTDTAEYHYLAWKKLADRLNIPFDRKINEQLKGVSRIESLEIILANSDKIYSDDEKLVLTDEKNTDYVSLISKITPADLLPGALDLLTTLKEKGYLIGLASSSKNAPGVIKNLKIAEYFDYIADPTTIQKGKPDPEIFLKAAWGLGLNPESCIGVEDARSGVQAIKSAGMFAVGVGLPEILDKADVVIKDLREFEVQVYSCIDIES